MPLFAVHALDAPNALPLRLELYAAHRSHRDDGEAAGVQIIFGGPLQSDDGSEMIGSCFIVEAPDRMAVDSFIAGDPFMRQGVWGEVSISRFLRRLG
ncbi:YciI family protein [Acidocella sp.]|uniref:YciI family protein n=1 Tax=Acidocella sp. TaxID=50710 RepID=UPI0026056F66|nr:YciI family protein [Acidocella sp.]